MSDIYTSAARAAAEIPIVLGMADRPVTAKVPDQDVHQLAAVGTRAGSDNGAHAEIPTAGDLGLVSTAAAFKSISRAHLSRPVS